MVGRRGGRGRGPASSPRAPPWRGSPTRRCGPACRPGRWPSCTLADDAAAEAAARLGPGGGRPRQGERRRPHGTGGRPAAGRRHRTRPSCWSARTAPGPSLQVVQPDRPTWLEIDLTAVSHNVRHLAARAAGCRGDGGAEGRRLRARCGAGGPHRVAQRGDPARRRGVPEARALRAAGIRAPILVLGYTPGWQARRRWGSTSPWPCSTSTRRGRTACRPGPRLRGGRPREGRHRHAPPGGGGPARPPPSCAISPRRRRAGGGGPVHPLRLRRRSVAGGRGGDRRPGGRVRPGAGDPALTGDRPPLVHAANSAGLLCRSTPPSTSCGPASPCTACPRAGRCRSTTCAPPCPGRPRWHRSTTSGPGESVGDGHTWTADRPSRVATVPVGYGRACAGPRPRGATSWSVGRPGPAGRTRVDGPDLRRRDRHRRRASGRPGRPHRSPGGTRSCRPPWWRSGWARRPTRSSPRSWPGSPA